VGSDSAGSEDQEDDGSPLDKDEFVVEKIIGICYGGSGRKDGIYFKVGVFLFSSCCLLLILKTSVCMHAILKNPQEQKFHNMEKVQHFKKRRYFYVFSVILSFCRCNGQDMVLKRIHGSPLITSG
jgi:hypothetical protein